MHVRVRAGRTEASRFAFSPIVTIEPRRRKFHRPITITLSVPKTYRQSDLNLEPPDGQRLRLLCSITGAHCAFLSRLSLSLACPQLWILYTYTRTYPSAEDQTKLFEHHLFDARRLTGSKLVNRFNSRLLCVLGEAMLI